MWLVVFELFVEILQLLVNHNAIVSVEILLLGLLKEDWIAICFLTTVDGDVSLAE